MSQNRNKLIGLFIGNLSNAIVHRILEKAIDEENIRKHYDKEFLASIDIAKRYREKINPINSPLPDKDISRIREKLIRKARAELEMRISKGYENISTELIEPMADSILRKMKIF